MKFKKSLFVILCLLQSCAPLPAFAQVTPRPIAMSAAVNGAGTLFIPTTTPFGNQACYFDNNSTLASSVTTSTELTYVHGVTSSIQAQINAISSGAVASVFGRTGAVTAQIGDYAAFYLEKGNNLSDLTSAATARANLGLGSACVQPSSAFDASGSAATAQANAIAASDPVGSAATAQATSLQKSANLSDLASASTARTNLGLGAAATQPLSAFLQSGNNLSDLASASTARTNLGLGTAAVLASSAFDATGSASTAQAASLQKTSNLSDLASAPTARTNLGLGTAATQPITAFDASGSAASAQAAAIAASDTNGAAAAAQAASLQKSANLSDLASVPTARTNLGLGTAAVQNTTAFDASGAAATVQASSLQKSANLSDLASAVTARTNLGLGTAATQSSGSFDASGSAAAAQAAAIAASDPSGTAATVQAASLQKSANLSDLASPSVARTNLGLGSAAVQNTSAFQAPLTFTGSLTSAVNVAQLVNDATNPGNSQFYGTNAFGLKGWYPVSGGGSGTVTSVGLTMPAWLLVSNSPITTSGTIAVTSTTQAQNLVVASPNGSAGVLTPRALVNADFPISGVSSGSYTCVNLTVNSQGIITSVASGSCSGGSGGSINVSAKSTNYTVLSTDSGAFDFNTAAGSLIATLPAASAFLVGGQSQILTFTKADTSANNLTVNPVGGDLIAGNASVTLTGNWTSFSIYSTGSGWAIR